MTLSVAVVQRAADTRTERNADQAADAIRAAARDGARLVVLPEYASGWAPRLSSDLAQPGDGVFETSLRDVAAAERVWVVAGTMRPGQDTRARSQNPETRARSQNVALLLGPDGRVAGEYIKVHLFDAFGVRESDVLESGTPGSPNVLVQEIDGLRVGVATCYDLRFPESFRVLADAGVEVIVVIAAWSDGPGKAEQLETLTRARALENTAYLVLSSQNGRGRVGRSAVLDPLGCPEQVAASDGPELLRAELDPGAVARVRNAIPSLQHRRFHVVPAAPR